ncbi:hypothetical protein CSB45_01735 [candidate division KSB3 bacterium]|uniref:Big-1 domain-containing protein n=1 Tax=candidate division KSB3 bacterium TaxID=2044937 RepID=A0A2G6EAM4_9BACT|nr:MAG: hypothetical protein CSB45_01735 [candidate division KSB3 bacterium]PIE30689.1 MAG: hypothetical protein CSA57_01615 [candidate division KSB3 bacterium]
MTKLSSHIALIVFLFCLSMLIIALLAGCDEKKIDVPILGSAAGSGPIGGGDAQRITLIVSPSENIPSIGNLAVTARITALVQNSIGQPVADGIPVYWTSSVGTLDTTSNTTSNGSSGVTLTFPEGYTGCSTVTAISGDDSDSIEICTTNSTPTPTATETPTVSATFIVSSSASAIPHGGTSTITAYVATNGVADENMQVTFNLSSGGTLSASAAVTDASGNARVTFTGHNTSANDITATITATTKDGRSGTAIIIVASGATPTPVPSPT